MDRIDVDGWLVAEANLEHGYYPHDGVDHVFVFRNDSEWSMVTLAFSTRFDDYGAPVAGSATATTSRFGSLKDLAEYVRGAYRSGEWVRVLDAGHDRDAELYEAWVPERMSRDLDGSSIMNRDLAFSSAYTAGQDPAAPGRALPDWQAHAVGLMAANLDEKGWEVFHDSDADVTSLPDPDEVAGVLRGRRYGYEAIVVVRVDDAGEIYARLPNAHDHWSPVVRALTDDDYGQ